MLIPVCAQFLYAQCVSPYANFSALLPVRIGGLTVCIRGPVSDAALMHKGSLVESRIEPDFFCMQVHTHKHQITSPY